MIFAPTGFESVVVNVSSGPGTTSPFTFTEIVPEVCQ
jgi:hypothetical protein